MRKVLLSVVLAALAAPACAEAVSDRERERGAIEPGREADRSWQEEGGGRDGKTVTAEIPADTGLYFLIRVVEEAEKAGRFQEVHDMVGAAFLATEAAGREHPGLRPDRTELARLRVINASAYVAEGDLSAAIAELEKSIRYHLPAGTEGAVYFGLGRLHLVNACIPSRSEAARREDYRAGMDYIEKAATMDPRHRRGLENFLEELRANDLELPLP